MQKYLFSVSTDFYFVTFTLKNINHYHGADQIT